MLMAGVKKDAPRGGRKSFKRDLLASGTVERTGRTLPQNATHWTVRTLPNELGATPSMVHRVWRANGLKPHLRRTLLLRALNT